MERLTESVATTYGSSGQILEQIFQGGDSNPSFALINVDHPYTGALWEQVETSAPPAQWDGFVTGLEYVTEFNTGTNPNWNFTEWGSSLQVTVTFQDYYAIFATTTPSIPTGSITTDAYDLSGTNTALAIAATAASKAEGQSAATPFTFTVTRSGVTTGASSVNWAVTGSGAAPAMAADFVGGVLPSGTVSFAAGETSKTITVNVAGDTAVEADEGFTVTLSAPTGAGLNGASAIGNIFNDDTGLAITATAASKAEGQSAATPFTFTVTRSGADHGREQRQLGGHWQRRAPAMAADFVGGVLPAGTVSFAAGETSKTVTVNVAGDTAVEADEGFTVTLSAPTGADLTAPANRHHSQRRHRSGDRGDRGVEGRGSERRHAVHLHRHAQRSDHGREQRQLGGHWQRRCTGDGCGLRGRRAARRHGLLRCRRDQQDHHGECGGRHRRGSR